MKKNFWFLKLLLLLLKKKVPSKTKCVELINKNPILKPRTWQQVNALIHNVITKKLRNYPPGFAL